jgi:signal transduction histidine kinase
LTTPLTTIVGYSELLLEEAEFTSEHSKEALAYIYRKGWALSRIVDDILNVSRIESGQGIPLNRERWDIIEITRRTVTNAAILSARHTFEISLPDSPLHLMVDEGKIVEVIENILSNAIKYSPEGGAISIRGEVSGNCFLLAIADNGIGMTPQQTARVFDKFYRADCSNTAIGGTGLGMSIVKHFIEALRGDIRIESEHGQGTTVFVTLPLTDNHEADIHPLPATPCP